MVVTKGKYIKSPMNYVGGKYRLLNRIIPVLQQENNQVFVDLFAGGLNVGINIDAKTIYANDRLTFLIELYEYFQSTPVDKLISAINETILMYSLDQQNIDGFNKLRKDYNDNKSPLKLFVLLCYSYNNQMRFNNKFEYNMAFGRNRSSFNQSIENNLIQFATALKEKNIILSSLDFYKFDFNKARGGLVYCDPPYLISNCVYNDGKRGFGGWKESDDIRLLELLDELNKDGIRFALSNVLYHKGEENKRLIEWSDKYHVMYLDIDYSNCNYQIKNKETKTVEVLITNYEMNK